MRDIRDSPGFMEVEDTAAMQGELQAGCAVRLRSSMLHGCNPGAWLAAACAWHSAGWLSAPAPGVVGLL